MAGRQGPETQVNTQREIAARAAEGGRHLQQLEDTRANATEDEQSEDFDRDDDESSSRPTSETPSTPQWPPAGFTDSDSLSPTEAQQFICHGAANFFGHYDQVPHAIKGHYRFFATCGKHTDQLTDRAILSNETYKSASLRLTGGRNVIEPWETLDQPCIVFSFGRLPGTGTLNSWISSSGSLLPVVTVDSKVKSKKPSLIRILERMRVLEDGLEEDGDLLYKSLYGLLISDPEKRSKPHYAMELQISDLITVLSHSDWINFSYMENHVVAQFFISENEAERHRFFLQTLLSIELYLRIHSPEHQEWAKRKLLPQIPPKIAWDLALAQRWLDNIAIERPKTSSSQSSISFTLANKERQKDVLRSFGWALKWPGMREVEYILEEQDARERAVEDRSADAMSWFSGVILPGRSMSFLLMNSLIDGDRDTERKLNALTHLYPNSGFQYRANTYWSWECVVGKVLGAARGVRQVAGWIGPCLASPDLHRTEVARVVQRQLTQHHTVKDVDTTHIRSHPLGMADQSYPVEDYDILYPDMDNLCNNIRIERLAFTESKRQSENSGRKDLPDNFDASLVFAIGGSSVPIPLTYDIFFVTAYPCKYGPHVLFYDYGFRVVNVSKLLGIERWGNYERGAKVEDGFDYNDVKEVLLVEAFGNPDNEVFARAWCARWGLSAVVAEIYTTCIACAIREAYAACVSVVILTEARGNEEFEEAEQAKGERGRSRSAAGRSRR
ncbi:MAG: hypothetical protein M1814_005886 [Vezdaea aestivalis]|nr:MAG: hypothetical protein M1814_005886 [Vezdaea aestivalis]